MISKPSILKLNALLDEIYSLYADYVMKVQPSLFVSSRIRFTSWRCRFDVLSLKRSWMFSSNPDSLFATNTRTEIHVLQRLHRALSRTRDEGVLLEGSNTLLGHVHSSSALSPRRGLAVRIHLLVRLHGRQTLELDGLAHLRLRGRLHELHDRSVLARSTNDHAGRHERSHTSRLQVRDHHHLAVK